MQLPRAGISLSSSPLFLQQQFIYQTFILSTPSLSLSWTVSIGSYLVSGSAASPCSCLSLQQRRTLPALCCCRLLVPWLQEKEQDHRWTAGDPPGLFLASAPPSLATLPGISNNALVIHDSQVYSTEAFVRPQPLHIQCSLPCMLLPSLA